MCGRPIIERDMQIVAATTQAHPGDEIPFSLINDEAEGCSFGAAYVLERNDAGEWIECNVEEAWIAIGLGLHPGRQHDWVVQIPEDAAPGRYRVRKQIFRADTRPQLLEVELEVVAP